MFGYRKLGPCGNNSTFVKLGFTKLSQAEQCILLPSTRAQMALTHSPAGQALFLLGLQMG